MSKVLLKVEHLSTHIKSNAGIVKAVDDVSFEIERGETFVLLGESGCGKSMTALSLLRLLPDAGTIAGGQVLLDAGNAGMRVAPAADLLRLPETLMRNVRGKRIAMIFQEPMLSLNPVMTVGEQIAETLLRHTSLRGESLHKRVIELMNDVGIIEPERRRNDYPFQFSGGMKQRVMIAIALACEPELLIADEPTTALDVTTQAQILELLRKLQREHRMALLLITHDLAIAAQMADRVAVMYAGEIVEIAPRAQFFASPAHPYSRRLFASLPSRQRRGEVLATIRGNVPSLAQTFVGCRFVERCDRAWELCRTQMPAWHTFKDKQGVRCHLYEHGEQQNAFKPALPPTPVVTPSAQAAPASAPILSVENLQVYFPQRSGLLRRAYDNVKAVDGVSFDIMPGRTLGLVGESGSGKTTVGKAILRLLDPAVAHTAGKVTIAGEDWTQLSRAQLRAKRSFAQIIFQDPYGSLNPRLRIGEILEEGMVALNIGSDAQDRAARIDRLLIEVGLTPEMKQRYPHEFSGGQRQRVAIARALSVEPRLIICDEPTSALDVSVQAQILNLLISLQQSRHLSYLFITHNIAAVEFLAHEIAVMRHGKIVEHGDVAQVLQAPKHAYTRKLLAAVPVLPNA